METSITNAKHVRKRSGKGSFIWVGRDSGKPLRQIGGAIWVEPKNGCLEEEEVVETLKRTPE